MNGPLSQGAWKIGTIIGIPIKVHFSWFIVFGLITWSLSTFYFFPQAAPDLRRDAKWEMSPDEEVLQALEKMLKEDVGRLVVREGDRITGLITRNGIARYAQVMGK